MSCCCEWRPSCFSLLFLSYLEDSSPTNALISLADEITFTDTHSTRYCQCRQEKRTVLLPLTQAERLCDLIGFLISSIPLKLGTELSDSKTQERPLLRQEVGRDQRRLPDRSTLLFLFDVNLVCVHQCVCVCVCVCVREKRSPQSTSNLQELLLCTTHSFLHHCTPVLLMLTLF